MIASSDCRGAERDIFYVEVNGYDHHSKMMEQLNIRFMQLNDALDSFVSELQDQGKFDDVAIVVTSDFGRWGLYHIARFIISFSQETN